MLIEKNTPLSYFADDNLAKLVRIHSRRKALIYDIARIFITVLFLEGCETVSILAGSVFYGRNIIYENIALYFLVNYVIKLFLILVQFMLEISVAYNFSFLIVYAVFICGLYSGGNIYERMLNTDDVSKQEMYKMINRFDLANYTSISRINVMSGDVLKTVTVVLGMIVFVMGVLFIYIKKADLFRKS